ncbi:MAG: hypothetical protein KA387_06980 [Rubrivivax sp.]|nr:hypothetical protein [Rubrivivax sp.]
MTGIRWGVVFRPTSMRARTPKCSEARTSDEREFLHWARGQALRIAAEAAGQADPDVYATQAVGAVVAPFADVSGRMAASLADFLLIEVRRLRLH